VVEDWANCIKRKPKSRRMDGLSITIIMTVFDPREREMEKGWSL
jgi:hypothetical protein